LQYSILKGGRDVLRLFLVAKASFTKEYFVLNVLALGYYIVGPWDYVPGLFGEGGFAVVSLCVIE
jgi:uncharacterized membrane protein YkvA (DUF1232 family)